MDLSAPGSVLDHRSWRWFQTRVTGLLAADTRLGRAFAPPPKTTPPAHPQPYPD